MRYFTFLILFMLLMYDAGAQVVKGAGIWYFNDAPNVNANVSVGGAELAYSINLKTFYHWNRSTSAWVAYLPEVTVVTYVKDTTTVIGALEGDVVMNNARDTLLFRDATQWRRITVGGGSTSYNGNRTITGQLLTGQNMGTTTSIEAFLNAVFFPSQSPTALLTTTIAGVTAQNQVLELRAAGADIDVVLNWTAGRQATTQTLASTVVAGTTITPNPNPGVSSIVTGTRNITLAPNITTSYNNVVTTTDGKTATSTANITWLGKRYYGFTQVATPNQPNDAELLGSTPISYFITSNNTVNYNVQPTAGRYMVIATPASFGNLSSLTINGFPSLNAFTKVTRNVTNASGFTQSYNIYTSNQPFNTTAVQFINFN